MTDYDDLNVQWCGEHVVVVEICRPPTNFFDVELIKQLADTFETLERNDRCRAVVLAAQGRVFCAGADFSGSGAGLFDETSDHNALSLYQEAIRLYKFTKPVVGAIQGPAIGGGLGLALVPDFRVVCHETRFAANFVQLGVHPGFGISLVLPKLIGEQNAKLMLLTGRRIKGEEALRFGLADLLVDAEEVQSAAIEFATEIAQCAPLAVESTRSTMRSGLVEQLASHLEHEFAEQVCLAKTLDHKEGVTAVTERRPGVFRRG
ncbi:enoyl-CoA hydratase [Marinobacter fuscus]|uniref:Enoyl-CoA hydratase n=1 Tax=Marinobacter fuscus TaxID=2109942 RepID=A0A2T1KP36_9GAMM|nr:enoyl-CoA hydratase/isomerase family protein [Marinobacter fuscus]PSF11906.1 enoyl-CoA hydratase [Marinobacter fuscus]